MKRQGDTVRKQGFVLLEVITAVVILSTLMVVTTQVWQSMAQNSYQQGWIDDAELIRQASLDYWIDNGEPPAQLSDVFSATQLETLSKPWQQSWFYNTGDNWLELSLIAPSEAAASWFAGKVAGAFVQGERLVVPVWQPRGIFSPDNLLHRQQVFGQPELNTMAADINMANHAITNVNNLTAQTITTDMVQASTIMTSAVRTSAIEVDILYANDVITPRASLNQLKYWVEQYEQLWLSCQQQNYCQ